MEEKIIDAGTFRDKYSNSTKNFKRPNTREDSSDLDKKNTVFIAAMRSTSGKSFYRHPGSKNMVSKKVFREKLFEYLSLSDDTISGWQVVDMNTMSLVHS